MSLISKLIIDNRKNISHKTVYSHDLINGCNNIVDIWVLNNEDKNRFPKKTYRWIDSGIWNDINIWKG